MKSIIRSAFSLMVMGAMIAPFAASADAPKCSPCQAAKSIRDALAQSMRDAQMAALAEGHSFSRQSAVDAEKCGCGCQRTCRDAIAGNLEKCGCGCQRTCRDAVTGDLATMAAAAAAALAAAKESELDEVPADASRAPREELADPCDPCGELIDDDSGCCPISRVGICCNIVNQRVIALTKASKKCCKKLGHKIHDVKELVEDLIDQSADCCSVTEAVLGDPGTSSFLDIPLCAPISAADALINSTDADILTWLKTIAELVYRVHSCVCCA